MYPLVTLKTACAEALEAIEKNNDWHETYCASVDPRSVLALIQRLETSENVLTIDELRSLGKLVRDLTGYIKMIAGDKPDPVRDDLLLQARQLSEQLGL
jgi:hypothetical protein